MSTHDYHPHNNIIYRVSFGKIDVSAFKKIYIYIYEYLWYIFFPHVNFNKYIFIMLLQYTD